MTDLQPIAQHVVDPHALMQQLEALKQRGANEHEPVRFRFIESLIHRALEQRESVRERLLQKAQQALDEYEAVLAVKLAAKPISSLQSNNVSSAISALSNLRKVLLADDADTHSMSASEAGFVSRVDASDATVGGVGATNSDSTMIGFTEQLAQQKVALLSGGSVNGDKAQAHTGSTAPLPRLKAGIAYQQFQHQQRIDHFIDSAFNETPENPGPLNPEILAIKLLKQINDLSPAYISRYVDYFETLQWLEQEASSTPKQKK